VGCLPCPGTVIGEDVQVLSVARQNGRRELVATCERGGRKFQIALLDVELKATLLPNGCSPPIAGGLSAAEDLNSYDSSYSPNV